VHCNFKLRGAESERDEAFVKSLGEKYAKEVLVKEFATSEFAAANKISIQEAARKLRYEWFNELVDSKKMTDHSKENDQPSTINYYLLTAHHANDNIETLLFNFFRGTGISGLHGILPRQGNLVRPLLFARRDTIVAYATEQQLTWVEDSSNASDKYSRNYIRHQVVPLMKNIFPSVEENLLNNIERMGEAETLYEQAIALHKKKLLEQKGNEIHIPVLKLKQADPLHTIIWEIIKDFGFSANQVNEIIKLLDAENGSYVQSSSHRIILNRKWLIVAVLQNEDSKTIIIEQNNKKINFEKGVLTFEHEPIGKFKIADSNTIAAIDADAITFPLLLRKYKTGDYFYPLGMPKKKKLSKFFIDQKLSKTAKENVWVIENDKKIIWVIGLRIDDRYKIKSSTTNVLRIQFIQQ
jgi:tRNA(Ile)-lysidine synthase